MTAGQHSHAAARRAVVGLALAGLALAGAAPAIADPGASEPAPTDPTVLAEDQSIVVPHEPAAPNPTPVVPEVANPNYGSGSGPLGTLKDLWHQARNPSMLQDPAQTGASAPPPGAGPAPALPPGYVSLNAPGSETVSTAAEPNTGPEAGGPALPEGYYPIDGPPPPGYEYLPAGTPPATAQTP